MKVGDLVKLSPCDYPQYRRYVGILISDHGDGLWEVHIKGKLHPYLVHQINLLRPRIGGDTINESR
jgi:hypothetical protein